MGGPGRASLTCNNDAKRDRGATRLESTARGGPRQGCLAFNAMSVQVRRAGKGEKEGGGARGKSSYNKEPARSIKKVEAWVGVSK